MSSRGAVVVASVALLFAFALAGCLGGSSDPVVDGWAIGDGLSDCTDRSNDLACGPYLAPALMALGGAPAGTTVTLHREGTYPGNVLATRGGGPVTVVVVTDGDGHRRAVGVYCGLDAPDALADCAVVTPPFG